MNKHTYIDATPYTMEELAKLVTDKGVDITMLDTDGFNTRYSMTEHETQEQSIIFVRKNTEPVMATSPECAVETPQKHTKWRSSSHRRPKNPIKIKKLPRRKSIETEPVMDNSPAPVEDMINHPKHYTHASIECIDITSKLSFSHGNAIKYLWRCGYKGDDRENIGKALFYIDRLIKEYEASPYKTRLKRWWELRSRDKRLDDVARDITYGYEIRTLYNYKKVEDLRELHNLMYYLHNGDKLTVLADRLF